MSTDSEDRHQTAPMRVVSHLLPPRVLTWRFGVLVLLLTIISLAIGTKSSIDTNQNTRCLADYARLNAEVLQARADASKLKDTSRDAFLDGVTDLITNPRPDAQSRKRLLRLSQNYQRSKAALSASQAANPLPDYPKNCGGMP